MRSMMEEMMPSPVLVLGNNQDGCLLTGDNSDVKELRLTSHPIFSRLNNNLNVGMNLCTMRNSDTPSIVSLWGRNCNGAVKTIQFNSKIRDISIGDDQMLIITEEGGVVLYKSSLIQELSLEFKVQKVFCGIRTVFLIDQSNFVFSYGSNKYNELGLIGANNISDLHLLTFFAGPVKNSILPDNVNKIKTGFRHTFFTCTDNSVWGAGDNSKGQLGCVEVNEIKKNISIAEPFDIKFTIEKIKQIACGWNTTVVLTEDGSLYSTGYGKFGQCGVTVNGVIPDIVNGLIPIKVDEIKFDKVFAGADYFFAIDSNFNLYSWGWNEHHNLGQLHDKIIPVPEKVQSELYEEMTKFVQKSEMKYKIKIRLGGAFAFIYVKPTKKFLQDNQKK